MDLQREGRQLALAFVNVDDIVLARELSASGIHLLSFAGRSLVGSAVVGAGVATRAAMLGARVATRSALAVANAASGRIPGADVARQVAHELDRSVARSGEGASFVASQGVVVAKPDHRPPSEPIFGEPWLAKRLRPGATSATVLVDSAFDLTRLAAAPLLAGTATLANALASPAGEQVTRSFWDAVSSIADSASRRQARGTSAADRSELRALLVMLGMSPLVAAAQDMLEFGDALSRASAGDGRKLKSALAKALDRMAAESPASSSGRHTPSRLFSALDGARGDEASRLAAIGKAMIEDSGTLSKLALAYASMISGLVTSSVQSSLSGALDLDAIEAWVRADEASRAESGQGLPEECPASVKRLETLVAAFSKAEADAGHVFAVPSAIDLARDAVFTYSTRALGRDLALVRMERLFGADARLRLGDDCSLRREIVDAKEDRDRRLAALVSQLEADGQARLLAARDRAADRLSSLTANSADRVIERMIPQRIGERIAVLQRFIGMADTAIALHGMPDADGPRQKAVAKFTDWISAAPAPAPVPPLA